MSRNDERLGSKFLQSEDIPEITQQNSQQLENPKSDFSFPSSTILIELPSKGKYYPENHPLFNKEHVEVLMMTAKTEDILTNKALLRKGVAIERMIHSLLVDKAIDVDSLLLGDKNAIIIGIRISGYGAEYETKFTCPSCNETQNASFDLEEAQKINYGENVEGVEISKDNTFLITLPRTKVVVECKLFTGKEEKELAFIEEKRKKHNLPESQMTNQLKLFIVSISNGSSKTTSIKEIENFIGNVPAIDSRFLRNTYKKVNPNVELISNFVCKSCQYSEEINTPIGVTFLWPG